MGNGLSSCDYQTSCPDDGSTAPKNNLTYPEHRILTGDLNPTTASDIASIDMGELQVSSQSV